MAKLVVEVVGANDLMPKDKHGSASPFVQVVFEGKRQRTSTKPKSLNPSWNEKLVFDTKSPEDTFNQIIEVFVYNDNMHERHNNFLGRVRISGISVPFSEQEAVVQRYPLDKRGIFSHVKGDIALKIYALSFYPVDEVREHVDGVENHNNQHHRAAEGTAASSQEIDTNEFGDEYYHKKTHDKKNKERGVKTFYSVGSEKPVQSTTTVMRMQGPAQKPEYGLVETKPPLAARMGYWGRDKTASTYDLVEPMSFLYVRVVKAMNLPVMDVSGSVDPYVEVKVGNYKGMTKHFEKTQNPVWNKVFAFSKERMQSTLIEVKVKDKDISKDDFVGKVTFDVNDIPTRVPPDSPLAPQWYKLVNRNGGLLKKGDIMLAVWMGTQADEAFPDAWHSDAHNVSQQNMNNTRSKVYFLPKLYYLRVHVIAAQDLVPTDKEKLTNTTVKVQVGDFSRSTRPSPTKDINPEWNEELMFVATAPFDEYIVVSVIDKDVIGRILIPLRDVPQRADSKLPDTRWYNLQKPSIAQQQGVEKKKDKFASRIHLRLSIDAGYHVLDEPTQFSSDLQPAAKKLRKGSIGILEVGILSARNLTAMKGKDGKLTDAYCVAKYGNKWVRTRTLLNNLHPRWNEQYTWEVYDPCTVMTIGVFDNCHVNGDDSAKDQKIGKVRIRLSTLETYRVYTHSYPLLVLTPSGLRKNGELHLAIRFTCTAWASMLTQYGKPLLPKMHYTHPISIKHVDLLRYFAMRIVTSKLSRAEPPLRAEVVDYMLDVDRNLFSLRRSKANFHRMMLLLSRITSISTWFHDICRWKNPLSTILVHILFLVLVCYPELIFPTFFLYLFTIGLWNYQYRPRVPTHMDARLSQAEDTDADELDEEFSPFPTPIAKPLGGVKVRYDRLRTLAGRVQTVTGDVAVQGERILSVLSWRDPRATTIFIALSLIWAVFLYVTPFQIVALLIGLHVLRHPRFRNKLPPAPVNFFKRLPSRSDSLL